MKTLNCRNCAQSGIGQQVIFVNGGTRCCCCGTVNPATITPRTWGESKDAYITRAFEVEAAPVAPETPACCHVRVIRRFYQERRKAPGFTLTRRSRNQKGIGLISCAICAQFAW